MPRVTIVTGGSRGIGAAICRRLAAEGHDVVVSYRTDPAAAEAVARDVRAAGVRALVVQADIGEPESVAALFAAAAELGPLTGLVNNAGAATTMGPLADLDLAKVRRDLDVDLFGVLACCQHAIRAMTTGGAIVNISSTASTSGSPNTYVHYAAAKAGVDAITIGLSKELGPAGIRVNSVAPGFVWSDFHADPGRPGKVGHLVPMGRSGHPEEIAGAVAWLLSDDASYTTGAILRISGGL